MRLSRAAVSVCLALAGLPLASSAAAAPAQSDSGRLLVNAFVDGERATYPMNPAEGTLGTPIAGGFDADYAPNGAWVVYTHDADPCTGWPICESSPDLWMATANGKQPHLLAEAPYWESLSKPDWSPNGGRILFSAPSGTSWIRPDGSGREYLPGVGGNATFSPDGTRIASFYGTTRPAPDETDNGVEVRITDVATMETETIATDWAGLPTGLDWSPDGNHIVYGGEHDLHVLDVNTGEYRAVIPSYRLSSINTPVFSPDGSRIAFTAWDTETSQGGTYVVNTDGTGLHLISDHRGDISEWVA